MSSQRNDDPPAGAAGLPDSSASPPDSTAEPAPSSVAGDARRIKLLTAPVPRTLIEMALPMVVGIAAIIMFQVVDTIFVGQLGTRELAAMTFTFPVAFVVFSVTMGLGIGTTSVISRAIGQGDRRQVRRLATHALLLSTAVVIVVAGLGIWGSEPVFLAMGAEPALMPLIRSYMVPWFCGVALLVIPMVGNSAIRATGDTKTPSIIMVVAGVGNVALDPLLIFGWGPVPALGLPGAAYATVGSWAITFAAAAWLLIKRERMVELVIPRVRQLVDSWRQILYVGLPAAATNLLIPLSTAVITRFVSQYGEVSVAGFGAATRLEALALVGVNGLATAVTPFVGQNYGSKNLGRVREAVRFVQKAALVWGLGMAALLAIFASPLAAMFSKNDPAVANAAVLYVRTVPISYGLLGMAYVMNTAFTAMNRPLRAASLVSIRLFGLAVPLAYFGSMLWALHGIFAGIAVGNGVVGVIAVLMMGQFLRTEMRLPATSPAR